MSRMWRYSLRWAMPHRPCPGAVELVMAEVAAGTPCPPEVAKRWTPGTGYAVSIDFLEPLTIKRWSDDRKADTRRRNLVRRLEATAPLFADELAERELSARPGYFAGKSR